VVDGCVFISCKGSLIYCINASNGKLIWFYYVNGSQANMSPAVYGNHVYAGADDGYLYCLNRINGTFCWRVGLKGELWSAPTIVDGRIYVGSGKNDLFCINASDASIIWRFPTSRRVPSSPAVADGRVFFASDDFKTYAVNASTGTEIWSCQTGSLVSSPSVQNGYVYIGSYNGYVYCLNDSTGTIIWQHQVENAVSSSPALAYGCVYVGCEDNNVYCLNASDGERIWRSSTGFWVLSSPAVADGSVYVGSEDNRIYCFDAFTGEKKWSYTTENYVNSSPAIFNNTLYVGSYDHHVYAFTLSNSTAIELPPETESSMPWTTIVFDVITISVILASIFFVAFQIHKNRRVKRDSKETGFETRKESWLAVHKEALCVLVIFVFSILLFFVNLGGGTLWAADEQTYVQWAFHMFKTGDYLTVWGFGGGALWIGKPPLIMWLMSFSYQIFGVNNFASRFWSAIFGALSLIMVFYLGKKLYNLRVGFVSAIILGTFTTFFSFARHAMTDVPLIFFSVASTYFLLLSAEREKVNRYSVLSGLFFALALMTKQFQALLIPIIALPYFALTKRSIKFFFTKRFALFFGVALLIISPYAIYMTLQHGWLFWDIYLVYSNITRVVSPVEGHVGDYLYYFSQMVNTETIVWVVLLPLSIGFSLFNLITKRAKHELLILLWITIVFAVFTVAQTKLYWYILPAFPAFALTIGSLLNQLIVKAQNAIRSRVSVDVFGGAKSWKRQGKQ
jgi:outer membrane protein assembly factor BamB